MKKILLAAVAAILLFGLKPAFAQNLESLWKTPPENSKSWTLWYWMNGAITKEGITADIEAMKNIGLEGTYIVTIRDVPEVPYITPSVRQLTPQWWEMVRFAFAEADRVGLKIGFHVCDGFALAGGPWITPELSMQKVVWSTTNVSGGKTFNDTLPIPPNHKGYYKDIAVFAYPTPKDQGVSTETVKPKVTTSLGGDASFLADVNNREGFRADEPCYIDYAFDKPFTCRTINIQQSGNNFQAQRLTVFASDDGVNFRKITQLQPPRQGWQNNEAPMTHSIEPTTARYFRFGYDNAGTEPGSEDLDAAKWKQNLRILSIRLSSEARINQYEAKNGQTWRVAPRTTAQQISDDLCLNPKQIIDITRYMDKSGRLKWQAPKGNWTILRMGHTSTGHTNATGGAGSGLECDKFNPEAIRLQFDSWFGKAIEVAGKDLASRVLKIFYIDSWECGSQNWSPVFRDEFRARRGYDIVPYLPLMAGIPIGSADESERVLHDVRTTISELVVDKFYAVLKDEAHKHGCEFSAESVAPTMLSDGMMHYKHTDIPIGEFWLQSPTHDKLNDVLDAVSGARVYGKNVVQAEAFTQLRMMFNEHPAMLKTLQDRHYALGINRLLYHVYVHNPWLDRKPGMTLDGIGLYFQRDQTWWTQGRAWVDYAQRCQSLLQFGEPVVDVAVFTGEELPRRAVLPDRLVPFLPGIFGAERVESERVRLANVGQPTLQMPVGVTHSANITGSSQWVNAMRGYSYDSFNADVLLNSARVENGRIVLAGGMSYAMLVVPGKHPMQPNPERISEQVAAKLKELSAQGATILIGELPDRGIGRNDSDKKIDWSGNKFTRLPYVDPTFDALSVERDFIVTDARTKEYATDVAYIHRRGGGVDIYFVSNQKDSMREIEISLRAAGRMPELWNPVNGCISTDQSWAMENNRTKMTLRMEPCESVFVVLKTPTDKTENKAKSAETIAATAMNGLWAVSFDTKMRGPENVVIFDTLKSWSESDNKLVKYYSGTAVYRNNFDLGITSGARYYLEMDELYNMAQVKVNGKECGILWTKPYRIDVTDAIKNGNNAIEIEVVNTWANRIMGDENFGAEDDDSKKIWTNARYRMADKRLVESGIVGNIKVLTVK